MKISYVSYLFCIIFYSLEIFSREIESIFVHGYQAQDPYRQPRLIHPGGQYYF
jgi:hypothetical protein